MELYAAGHNAWNQLDFPAFPALPPDPADGPQPDDMATFTRVLQSAAISCVRPRDSYTEAHTAAGPQVAGLVPRLHARLRGFCPQAYERLALAGNGVVAAYDDDGRILQYSSLEDVLADAPAWTWPGFHGLCQLVSFETGFVALTSDGQVWTWGDERYTACLGRDVSDESNAGNPGLVSALEDLPTGKIVKVAAGGYHAAALTSGNDLYCWGGHPGRSPIVEDISSDPSPVDVADYDIADFGIGMNHFVVLTTNGEVYVIGSNSNGQLGKSRDKPPRFWDVCSEESPSVKEWMKISIPLEPSDKVVGLAAGRNSSFLLVQKHPG